MSKAREELVALKEWVQDQVSIESNLEERFTKWDMNDDRTMAMQRKFAFTAVFEMVHAALEEVNRAEKELKTSTRWNMDDDYAEYCLKQWVEKQPFAPSAERCPDGQPHFQRTTLIYNCSRCGYQYK